MSFNLSDVSDKVKAELSESLGPNWFQDEKCIPDVVAYLLIKFSEIDEALRLSNGE